MFDKFEYSKNWENPTDFPTVETDETQVRADIQLLYDEAKKAVWDLVDALAAQSSAANLGADDQGGATTIQALLTSLRSNEHNHADLPGLEALAGAFAGMTPATAITDDAAKVPTSKAIFDYIKQTGNGDMVSSVYDSTGKGVDIFLYADEAVGTHEENHENPHAVSKEQLGLGQVDNTSDEEKPLSAAARTALAGKVNTSDVIGLAHGGTGATTAAAARNALGLGNTTGPLPVANGGTGTNSVAGIRNTLKLGNTTGPVPIANGGTGKATASEACAALGAMPKSGGTFSGPVTFHRMILTSQDYGTSLPTTNLTVGRLFFREV